MVRDFILSWPALPIRTWLRGTPLLWRLFQIGDQCDWSDGDYHRVSALIFLYKNGSWEAVLARKSGLTGFWSLIKLVYRHGSFAFIGQKRAVTLSPSRHSMSSRHSQDMIIISSNELKPKNQAQVQGLYSGLYLHCYGLRVYLGVHYPNRCYRGALMGFAILNINFLFMTKLRFQWLSGKAEINRMRKVGLPAFLM